ncbi:EthD family reductase (plasmid) [Paraburkholderia sp. PREW-6R]|uniref:EthD family reductase n=1 Tax=Paraburkholderia sp. PREW-6R TaxID=3141544 RepID=UPI0031F4BB5B
MQACLFLTGRTGPEPLVDALALQHAAARIEGLRRMIVHEPVSGQIDPRITARDDAPSCAIQCYFDELAPLEAALQTDGAIHRALSISARVELHAGSFTQQVMAVRGFTPPTAAVEEETYTERCTYLVAYEGPADDFNAWLTHYLHGHSPLMLRLPGVREVEIYTGLDSTSGLPFARAHAMQRNKVVFDDASALANALASPIRDEMRRHFHTLPPFQGAAPHFAMRSKCVKLAQH